MNTRGFHHQSAAVVLQTSFVLLSESLQFPPSTPLVSQLDYVQLLLLCVTCCPVMEKGGDSSRLLDIQDLGKMIVLHLYLKKKHIMCLVLLMPSSSVVYTQINILGIHIFLLEKIYRDQRVSPLPFFLVLLRMAPLCV